MSKGPGKWQRAILAALVDREAIYLMDLLPANKTAAQYNAIDRAAIRLWRAGLVELTVFVAGNKRVVVHRLGTTIDGNDRGKIGDYRSRLPSRFLNVGKLS
jgi:hypothetical protein